MTPQEKARELARLLNAWADEKTLQQAMAGKRIDYTESISLVICSPPDWLTKREPRKAWSIGNMITEDEGDAKAWKETGHTVTEWQEVVK